MPTGSMLISQLTNTGPGRVGEQMLCLENFETTENQEIDCKKPLKLCSLHLIPVVHKANISGNTCGP